MGEIQYHFTFLRVCHYIGGRKGAVIRWKHPWFSSQAKLLEGGMDKLVDPSRKLSPFLEFFIEPNSILQGTRKHNQATAILILNHKIKKAEALL